MIERALIYELERAIPELKGQTYPTNAPKESKRPYLVYYRHRTLIQRTLDGDTGAEEAAFMFSIMAAKYEDMTALRQRIRELLATFPGRGIGKNGAVHIEDLTVDGINETYEFELKMHRGIIDFTIYY